MDILKLRFDCGFETEDCSWKDVSAGAFKWSAGTGASSADNTGTALYMAYLGFESLCVTYKGQLGIILPVAELTCTSMRRVEAKVLKRIWKVDLYNNLRPLVK